MLEGLIVIIVIIIVLKKAKKGSRREKEMDLFEKRFAEQFGRSPEQFINDKLANGSDIDAIEYLYYLNADKIHTKYGIPQRPFEYYYKKPEASEEISDFNNEVRSDEEPIIVKYDYTAKNFYAKGELKSTSRKSTKKKKQVQPPQKNDALFEKFFLENYNCTPEDYIYDMMRKGHNEDEISSYYDLRATVIGESKNIVPVRFAYYYKKVKDIKETHPKTYVETFKKTPDIVCKIEGCRKELLSEIKGISFGNYFHKELDDIFSDEEFLHKVELISAENKDVEFLTDRNGLQFTLFKTKTLPELFFETNLDMKPSYRRMCEKATKAGYSEKSVIITVYYLVRMVQLFVLPPEKRTVNGLAEAINSL